MDSHNTICEHLGQEHRDYPRLKGTVLEYALSQSGTKTASLIKDIGAGGVCFFASDVIFVGMCVYLEIYLPHERLPVKLIGKVIWRKEVPALLTSKKQQFEVGIEFHDGSFAQYQHIVKHLLPYYSAKE